LLVVLALAGCSSEKTPKHRIGGTVTGLAGSGLVLATNLGDVLAVSASGAFAFPTAADEGTAYVVTVSLQPISPWQTCSVSNGTGTIGGGDVSSVLVACTTNTYAVGGTVSGLAAGGTLVLRNNGGDDVTVTSDGPFAFPTAPPSGTTYAVTVLSKPPSQTCTVAGGTWTLLGAGVTSVLVTCATDSYDVGGTVSGLVAGGTLVLRNNGGDDKTIGADGPFTFAAKVLSGAGYAVTILSAPPSQTCLVANGSGTVGVAPVTDVLVTCTTNSYTVGGTVSGLAAGGTLVLRNNGGDDATITADGAFTFATPVLSGAGYAVTVQSKPASQTCTVANGSGTVGIANVTDVAVTCVVDTYAVGGSVAGLAGTGLVLHADLGAGEDLPVAAGATAFTFTNKAPSGSTVHVSVKTQPSSPAETCTVAGSPVTIGVADVTSLAVSCTSAIQRWEAPAMWGGLWANGPTMVQHAYFDGSGIVETKGVTWAMTNGSLPAQHELTAFPGGSRWGAGPFEGPRYQATAGDSGFDFPTDMLACAVVKPDFNPVLDGGEHVIMAKGIQDQAGWVLLQKHHMFNFYYRWDDGAGNNFTGNAYTPTYFADQSIPDNGTLNPSYVVVCGGRNGDTLVASANSFPDAAVYPYTVPVAGAPLYKGTTPHRLTIGGYDDGDPAHTFGGRVYETAIWNEPATAANIQAKFAAILNLPAGARYTRNREGPFVGPDGQYHTAWRHAPRAYLPGAALGSGGGYLFGLQGWNRLTQPFTPPDPVSQINPFIAYGEALDLWTKAGGATVLKDQLAPPGDSAQNGAERVTLPAGASLSTALGSFDGAGPIHGMLWIRRVSASGTLRVSTTQPANGTTSQQDVNLASLPSGQWTRVWLNGLTNDGSQSTAATLSLTNAGGSSIDFYAWGVDLTQIGRGGDLGAFDPGLEMYDWSGTAENDEYPIDVLQLPAVPASTAATGFCLSVEAQPPAGLAWTAPFVADRAPLTWVSDANGTDVVDIFMAGTGNGVVSGQKLCAYVSSVGSAVCWLPTWGPGTQHTITVCAEPTGTVTLYGDGVQVGTPKTGAAPFDLASGHLVVGGNTAAVPSGSLATWQGFVTKVAVCPAASPTACR